MDDQKIVDMYWARDELALTETQMKYDKWCSSIAYRVLGNREDTEECVQDTYMSAWDHIPPQRPVSLKAWLGKITRNLAISRYRSSHAAKRGGSETAAVLEELENCIGDSNTPEAELDRKAVTETLNQFLAGLEKQQRCVFVRRYWYLDPVKKIAERYEMTEGQVSSMLYRQRQQLKTALAGEGIAV